MNTLPLLLELINKYLKDNNFPDTPEELYEPCKYILGIGGKRIRPALALMGYELFKDNAKKALPIAAAVELFHNFTLMHDDIMDNAPLRRGQITVHEKYDLNTGILSGDVMLIYAYRFLEAIRDKSTVLDLIKIFNKVAIGVCEGQQFDVVFEKKNAVSIPEYIKMIELKTAVLLGGALEMGAVCAKAPKADAEHLYHFGRLSGIAFQIQDDLLDTYGDPATFGKQVGGDILQNKKTLLVLKTLEIAPKEDAALLGHLLTTDASDGERKVAAVRAIFDKNNIPELVAQEKEKYQKEAFRHLEAVNVPDTRKEILKGVITDLLVRDR